MTEVMNLQLLPPEKTQTHRRSKATGQRTQNPLPDSDLLLASRSWPCSQKTEQMKTVVQSEVS